jgi:hypothetical protein
VEIMHKSSLTEIGFLGGGGGGGRPSSEVLSYLKASCPTNID